MTEKGAAISKSFAPEAFATIRGGDSSLRRRGVDGRTSPAMTAEAPGRVGSNQTTVNAIRALNLLDKIRNMRYVLPLAEPLSRSPVETVAV
jgi:hypothetical protein